MQDLGKLLIFFGAVLIAVGVIFSLVHNIPWLGRLPGDIIVKRQNFQFYFPITTSIHLSVVISLLLRIFRK